jgi:capsular polysaccharide biosynthesis protein
LWSLRFPDTQQGKFPPLAEEPYLDDAARRKLTIAHGLLERAAADLEHLQRLLDAPELNRKAVHRPLNDAIQFTLYVLEELTELQHPHHGPAA